MQNAREQRAARSHPLLGPPQQGLKSEESTRECRVTPSGVAWAGLDRRGHDASALVRDLRACRGRRDLGEASGAGLEGETQRVREEADGVVLAGQCH